MPSIRIAEFDTWRPGYGFSAVGVLVAGTNTYAPIFADEALTLPLVNPQTLVERVEDDISYGRFSQPVYVGVPYQLSINSVDETGVTRPPLITLADQDASLALVTVTGGLVPTALADLMERTIDVRDYGEFKAVGDSVASPTTNDASLIAALGVAGARGGGYVEIPDGTYQIVSFTLPQGVVLRGAGRSATILQSLQAGAIATIGGARAGLERLTIDGISQVSGSVGVYAENKDQMHLSDVEIKRFATGLYRKGGMLTNWNELYISDCQYGYKAHGDSAVASGNVGGVLQNNYWYGGKVELCSIKGIEFKNVDLDCSHNVMRDVGFDTNTGTAISIIGARATAFKDCWWFANTSNLTVEDGSPVTVDNTVIGIEIQGGSIEGGSMTLAGNLEGMALRRVDLTTVAVTLNVPSNNVLVEDCREISQVTFSGTPTAWLRHKTGDRGSSTGATAGNAATKAWAISLNPGQQVFLVAKVIGRQRNGINTGFYYFGVSAGRPGASLPYDTQTANFTPGGVITGSISGASARITADSDGGTTGTLTLQDISGVFVDNEIITDSSTGSATVNGGLTFSNAALVGAIVVLRAAQETDVAWDATFVANGPQIELRVTGNSAQTVEWTSDVDVVST